MLLSETGKRRTIKRTEGGWRCSTIHGYLQAGDDATYLENFRCDKQDFEYIVSKLSPKHLKTNKCRDEAKRITAEFKVAVCLYFFAGHGKGDTKAVGDAASIGKSTVEA